MNRRTIVTATALTVAAFGFGTPALAQPLITAVEGGGGGAPDDALRTGGCSGCFQSQLTSALHSFSNVTRMWRMCATASPNGAASNLKNGGDACDSDGVSGAGDGGTLGDYVIIQGDLKDSTTADDFNNVTGAVGADGTPDGLGVPGGAVGVTYRVSANGSSRGNECAQGANSIGIGYLAPEGFDGLPNTADDAGGTGVFGATVATGGNILDTHPCAGADVLIGTADDTCAPSVEITGTRVDGAPNILGDDEWPAAGTAWSGGAGDQIAVVNYDIDGSGEIDRAAKGAGGYTGCSAAGDCPAAGDRSDIAAGATLSTTGTGGASNETTNLSMQCNNGCGDLPGVDFSPPKPPFFNETKLGAQIFKLMASNDVHGPNRCFVDGFETHVACNVVGDCGAVAGTGVTTCEPTKINLNVGTIQNIFGDAGNTSICAWEVIGATGTPDSAIPAALGSGSALPSAGINLSIRVAGSGTRNTFREVWMIATDGDKSEFRDNDGQPVMGFANIRRGLCQVPGEDGGPTNTAFKDFSQFDTGGDTANCLDTGACSFNGIGYVNGGRTKPNAHDVVIQGIDPETNFLPDYVECGMWPYWGPLACGEGWRGTGAYFTAQRAALQNLIPFAGDDDYLPFNEVAARKLFTDAPYTFEYVPTSCNIVPNPPAPKP